LPGETGCEIVIFRAFIEKKPVTGSALSQIFSNYRQATKKSDPCPRKGNRFGPVKLSLPYRYGLGEERTPTEGYDEKSTSVRRGDFSLHSIG
jgi:hypothetical protein